MKINFTRVGKRSPDIPMLRQLYTRAFPDAERAPFLLLLLKAGNKGVDFWSVRCDGEWAGMLYIVSKRDLSYVFYLAVDESCRGKGVGTAIIKAAKQYYAGRRLFLAIEQLDESAENYTQRVKRRDFYLRCGFTELHRKLREGPVVYEILACGGDVKAGEYKELMSGYAGSILSKLFTMEFVDNE